MDGVAIRVFAFSVLPVIIAVGHLGLDSSSRPRERRLEIFLLYLFGVGVAGSGIGGFFGHVFISDPVAESIGWPTGNPFQLEVGVANLAVGLLGVVAMGRRDGFREATVIAATVFGVGATVMPEPRGGRGTSASRRIDARIEELADWRGKTLSRVRTLIKQADPEVVEEWKWRGVPVWSHDGLICTGETYRSVVKMTFARGAALEDPAGLFNSSLEGTTRRASDLHAGEKIDEAALKALVRAAVRLNVSRPR